MRDFVSIEVHDLVWVKSCFISLCTLPHHQAWTQKKKQQIIRSLSMNEITLLQINEFLFFPNPKTKPWLIIYLMCFGQIHTFIANSVWTTVILSLTHYHQQTLVHTLRDLRNLSNKWLPLLPMFVEPLWSCLLPIPIIRPEKITKLRNIEGKYTYRVIFFNGVSPQFAGCWPVSKWFQKKH